MTTRPANRRDRNRRIALYVDQASTGLFSASVYVQYERVIWAGYAYTARDAVQLAHYLWRRRCTELTSAPRTCTV